MPRFYLHLCNGAEFAEDDEGHDCADATAAQMRALEGLRDVLAGDLRDGRLNTSAFIEIEDEGKQIIGKVAFEDAVSLQSRAAVRPSRLQLVPSSPDDGPEDMG